MGGNKFAPLRVAKAGHKKDANGAESGVVTMCKNDVQVSGLGVPPLLRITGGASRDKIGLLYPKNEDHEIIANGGLAIPASIVPGS